MDGLEGAMGQSRCHAGRSYHFFFTRSQSGDLTSLALVAVLTDGFGCWVDPSWDQFIGANA